jgi:hypothetical protein
MADGTFNVARGVFDHPVFAPEPFTEREAWLWLIAEAQWKPVRKRVRDGRWRTAKPKPSPARGGSSRNPRSSG